MRGSAHSALQRSLRAFERMFYFRKFLVISADALGHQTAPESYKKCLRNYENWEGHGDCANAAFYRGFKFHRVAIEARYLSQLYGDELLARSTTGFKLVEVGECFIRQRDVFLTDGDSTGVPTSELTMRFIKPRILMQSAGC